MFRTFRYPLSPWRDVERLRHEMDRLFQDFPSRYRINMATSYPAMNVWTNENGAVVTAELPGVSPENIEISVVNDTLTLSGKRDAEECGEDVRFHRRERGCGAFTRSFQLPFQVDPGKVEAALEKGVLKISLPRAEADKPRKIAVKAS